MGLGDTGFLLIEFGFAPLEGPDDVIRHATDRGWRVIVAHPERYDYPSPSAALEYAARWAELGAYLQVNLGSLHGLYEHWTSGSRALAWRLLREGLAHLIASDDHGDGRPQCEQRRAMEAIARQRGGVQAERLLSDNPLRVLRGEPPLAVARLPEHVLERAV